MLILCSPIRIFLLHPILPTLINLPHLPMFRASTASARPILRSASKRGYASGHQNAPATTQNEIDIRKVFGVALLAGVSLYFFRSAKDPVIRTPLYNQSDDRIHWRNDAHQKVYKTSMVKAFMRDHGGIGQQSLRKYHTETVPTVLIPTHSPYRDVFGAGIKTSELGPRRERVKYFAPLEHSD